MTPNGKETADVSGCYSERNAVERGNHPLLANRRSAQRLGGLFSKPRPASFSRRKSQRRLRGENRREAAAHLAERSRKTSRFAAQKDTPLRLWRLGKVRKRPLHSPVAVVCTIVPGARCTSASSSDIFTSRGYAGLRPAEGTIQAQFASESVFFASQRLARPHCEKRGESGVDGVSARSGCAKQRSLLCPLSERRRRHPRLFAVLDFLVLLGQAKSTRKTVVNLCLHEVAALQRRAGRSLRPRRPATKAYAPQTSTRRHPHIGPRLAPLRTGQALRVDRQRLGKSANSVCFCARLAPLCGACAPLR